MKTEKPIKQWDMYTSYILAVVAQLLTVVLWFLPTLKAESYLHGADLSLDITLFAYSDQLSATTNVINIALLLLSICSVIYMAMPLVKKTVMQPRSTLFPAVLNLVYLVLFCLRYSNALSDSYSFSVSLTPVAVIYFMAIAISFAFSVTILIYTPKLRKQLSNALEK